MKPTNRKHEWAVHVKRMDDSRFFQNVLTAKPGRHRKIGRPRWLMWTHEWEYGTGGVWFMITQRSDFDPKRRAIEDEMLLPHIFPNNRYM